MTELFYTQQLTWPIQSTCYDAISILKLLWPTAPTSTAVPKDIIRTICKQWIHFISCMQRHQRYPTPTDLCWTFALIWPDISLSWHSNLMQANISCRSNGVNSALHIAHVSLIWHNKAHITYLVLLACFGLGFQVPSLQPEYINYPMSTQWPTLNQFWRPPAFLAFSGPCTQVAPPSWLSLGVSRPPSTI